MTPLGAMTSVLFLVVIVTMTSSTRAECNVPSDFWCDNPDISRDCGVTEQCKNLQRTNAKPVTVGLYYESLCPGCRSFIIQQLFPVFQKVGSIMDVELVPYGNAQYQQRPDLPLKYYFTCQHGVEECVGNLIETCSMDMYKNASDYFPFIHCIESSGSVPRTAAYQCATQFRVDYTKIMACTNSANGHYLEYLMAVKTDNLQPAHRWTPWITINGAWTNALQNEAMTNLLALVCRTYTGSPKPAGCSGL